MNTRSVAAFEACRRSAAIEQLACQILEYGADFQPAKTFTFNWHYVRDNDSITTRSVIELDAEIIAAAEKRAAQIAK